MALALERLVAGGMLKSVPLKDSVAATSVGLINGEPTLDLCYEEDARAEVDMNVIMTGKGRFVEIQATAEGGRLPEKSWTGCSGSPPEALANLQSSSEL